MSAEWSALTMHYGFRFVLAALATWRLTHVFAREDGPLNLLRKFRGWLGQGVWGKLISCFYCLSLWIALPFAPFVGGSLLEMLVTWWAISGAAILLERATRDLFEIKLEDDTGGMLRTDSGGTTDDPPERP